MKLIGIKISLCGLAMTSLLLATACERRDTNMPKVYRAVAKFHAQFNAGRFHDMYTNTDSRFRDSISENDFVAKLNDLRQKNGEIQESKINGIEGMIWWQRYFPETKLIRSIAISSKCTNGRIQEFFDLDVREDAAKITKFDTDMDSFNNNTSR